MSERGISAKQLGLLAATALTGAAVAIGISACGGSSPTAETAPVTGLTVPGGGSGAAVKPAPATTAPSTTNSADGSSGGASPGGDTGGSGGSSGGSDSGSGNGGSSSGGSTPAPGAGGASPG